MRFRQTVAPALSLFTSTGTLICCALPAAFILFGMGSTFASLTSTFPQLIWLSQHKTWIFIIAGMALCLAAYTRWMSRNDPCPADAAQAKACARLRFYGGIMLYGSIAIYLIGVFFAFIAPKFL